MVPLQIERIAFQSKKGQSMVHPVVSHEAWLEARKALLDREKAFTRERDALAAARRALPRVEITTDYRFEGEDGEVGLPDLFGAASQLIVSHFMYGPDWEAGCPSCSFWADGYDPMTVHLAARDVAFVAVSRAPLVALLAYRDRMGWRFPWVSSQYGSFSRDFGVSFDDEALAAGAVTYNYRETVMRGSEAPGLSVFYKDEAGRLFHTYSCYSRGLDPMNAAYQLLDIVPKGRDEQDLPFPMTWVRRRDEY